MGTPSQDARGLEERGRGEGKLHPQPRPHRPQEEVSGISADLATFCLGWAGTGESQTYPLGERARLADPSVKQNRCPRGAEDPPGLPPAPPPGGCRSPFWGEPVSLDFAERQLRSRAIKRIPSARLLFFIIIDIRMLIKASAPCCTNIPHPTPTPALQPETAPSASRHKPTELITSHVRAGDLIGFD